MRKPYLVLPGFARSKKTGEIKYIDAGTLIKFYRVNKDHCEIVRPNEERSEPDSQVIVLDVLGSGMKDIEPVEDIILH